tara:strand:- start:1877 stop:2362 length:486 start_codon:yes stop_codon:yes gene_type:complete
MSRVNKTKVLLGGAMNRKNPSKASCILSNLNLLNKDVLDFGCGYGFDADFYKWDKFDPYYYDKYPDKKFYNIVCINVLNVVSKRIRKEIITNIQELLTEDGIAYLCVPRNVPKKGKYSGFERRPQNYVVLSLESIYIDKNVEIYELTKKSTYVDNTINIGE